MNIFDKLVDNDGLDPDIAEQIKDSIKKFGNLEAEIGIAQAYIRGYARKDELMHIVYWCPYLFIDNTIINSGDLEFNELVKQLRHLPCPAYVCKSH